MTVMDRACGWRFENDAGSQIAPKFKKKKNTPKNYERKTAKMTETEKELVDGLGRLTKSSYGNSRR